MLFETKLCTWHHYGGSEYLASCIQRLGQTILQDLTKFDGDRKETSYRSNISYDNKLSETCRKLGISLHPILLSKSAIEFKYF